MTHHPKNVLLRLSLWMLRVCLQISRANLQTTEEVQADLVDLGFGDIEISDVTEEVFGGFSKFAADFSLVTL